MQKEKPMPILLRIGKNEMPLNEWNNECPYVKDETIQSFIPFKTKEAENEAIEQTLRYHFGDDVHYNTKNRQLTLTENQIRYAFRHLENALKPITVPHDERIEMNVFYRVMDKLGNVRYDYVWFSDDEDITTTCDTFLWMLRAFPINEPLYIDGAYEIRF